MPRKVFVADEVLTALDVNRYLMDQAVQTFANAADRDAMIPSPSAGMLAYLADTDTLTTYGGPSGPRAGWRPVPDSLTPTGTGDWIAMLGAEEQTSNQIGTNPTGSWTKQATGYSIPASARGWWYFTLSVRDVALPVSGTPSLTGFRVGLTFDGAPLNEQSPQVGSWPIVNAAAGPVIHYPLSSGAALLEWRSAGVLTLRSMAAPGTVGQASAKVRVAGVRVAL
jgi:hypothetical protein